MPRTVDPTQASTDGLTSSPVAEALGGLRAHEARYFTSKFQHAFTTEAAQDAPEVVARVTGALRERDLEIASAPLEATEFEVDGVRWSYVFYESGLAVNVLWTLAEGGKRAVGFKLSEGMDVPAELEPHFRFARQRSALAGTIRGSYFVLKGEH